MHFLIINKIALVVSRAMIQGGTNRPTVVDANIVISCYNNIKINLKDKAIFVHENLELNLIVVSIERARDNDKVVLSIKLSDPLYLSKFSGGFYLYNDKLLGVFNKLLRKYDYNYLIGDETNTDSATIVQLPYESDYDLILRLAKAMAVNFFLKNNCVYSINECEFHDVDEIILKVEICNKEEVLIHYCPKKTKLYTNKKVKFNQKIYHVKEQNIKISDAGIIKGTLLLINNMECIEHVNSNNVFIEGVIVKENIPHSLYEVKVRFGDTVKAMVLNYTDNDQTNNMNIRYQKGQNVLLICSTSFKEIWILGCVDLCDKAEVLPCRSKYNKFSFKLANEIIHDNKNILISVGSTIVNTSTSNNLAYESLYQSDKIKVSSFKSLDNKSNKYHLKSVKYIIDANKYTLYACAILSVRAKGKEICNERSMIKLDKAHYKCKKLVIKNQSLKSKFNASHCAGNKVVIKCGSLEVNANNICLLASDGGILLQGDRVEVSSNNLSLNAKIIQLNGVVVGGCSVKRGVQKVKDVSIEEYEEDPFSKDREIIIQDELEELLGKGSRSIVDGINLKLDNKEYKIDNNKITFATNSILSDVSMD